MERKISLTMKKHMIMVLLLVFAALANPMQAQEADNSMQREIDSLNAVVRRYEKEIEVKERKLKPVNDKKNECDKRDKSLSHYGTLKQKMDTEIDSIQRLLAMMRRPCDSLKAVNESLDRYKTQVAPLVKRQLSLMATTVDNTWLGMTYAEIDMDELTNELKLYEDFKDNRGVAEAYEKLKSLSKDVMLYMQGVEIVNSPYDADRIATIMQPFENLVNKERHAGRKAESAVILGQLKGYSDCLKCIQKDIIGELEKRKKNYKDDGTYSMAWIQLKRFLESASGSANVKKISQIPWLEKQYQQYVKQLEKDPYALNPARDAIMGLQP